jgi:hypothetical protein
VIVSGELVPRKGDAPKLIVENVLWDASCTLRPKSVVFPSRPDPSEGKYLFFCDFHKGKIDPWQYVRASAESFEYLRGGLALKPQDRIGQLRYYLGHLEDADSEIAKDAFLEVQQLTGSRYDFRGLDQWLQPAKLIEWMRNKNIPVHRRELYAVLLGHCGGEWGAVTLHRMLEEACAATDAPMLEGLLLGYTLLRPANGWSFTLQILSDPSKEFTARYRALRVARFIREVRPSLVSQKELIAGVSLLLQQPDMADLVIEDLCKWGCRDVADQVLALWKRGEFDIPIIRRSILRFALSYPDTHAAMIVMAERQIDAEKVEANEELLKVESDERSREFVRYLISLGW